MKLGLEIDGATTEELQRGLEAAAAVFKCTGIHPVIAKEGMFAVEGWDIKGFPEGGLNGTDSKAASVWIDAEMSALDACCADWPKDRPRKGGLRLEMTEEERQERYG